MDRRRFLAAAAALHAVPAWAASELPPPITLGAAWRGAAVNSPQRVGALRLDGAAVTVRVAWSVELPSRAHGLLPEAGGGLLVVATRPGRWLLRLDGDGRVMRRLSIDDEPGARRFDGHALRSADGRWLYTPETAPDGQGWLSVRDADTLRQEAAWPTGGVDPHHLLLDAQGHVMLAHGGILRTPEGHKRDLDRMASSLVRIDGRNGRRLGEWRLDDPRLSLRHLAWSTDADGAPLLGVALQSEHHDRGQRTGAPVLAVWDGAQLRIPSRAADGEGYAGDIASAARGGFALSGQKAGRALLWLPGRDADLHTIARLTGPCALAPADAAGGVLVAGARGAGRWHPVDAPRMLAWPEPMALDNHWVVLRA